MSAELRLCRHHHRHNYCYLSLFGTFSRHRYHHHLLCISLCIRICLLYIVCLVYVHSLCSEHYCPDFCFHCHHYHHKTIITITTIQVYFCWFPRYITVQFCCLHLPTYLSICPLSSYNCHIFDIRIDNMNDDFIDRI